MSAGEPRPELETRTVEKPWGHELIWALTDRYCGKILFVRGGESLSLQYHRERDESWYVLEGRAVLEFGRRGRAPRDGRDRPGRRVPVRPADRAQGQRRSTTRGSLEVSTPELDDVVRLEDRYGRTE